MKYRLYHHISLAGTENFWEQETYSFDRLLLPKATFNHNLNVNYGWYVHCHWDIKYPNMDKLVKNGHGNKTTIYPDATDTCPKEHKCFLGLGRQATEQIKLKFFVNYVAIWQRKNSFPLP